MRRVVHRAVPASAPRAARRRRGVACRSRHDEPRSRSGRVYVGLAALCLALFVVGADLPATAAAHTPICQDGKPPVAQQDVGIGQVEYRCHDGQIVTK